MQGLYRHLPKHRCVEEVYTENRLMIEQDKNKLNLGPLLGGHVEGSV